MGVTFLLTSLVIVATPGTGAIYTMAAGLSRGARASILAAFASTLGIVPHLVAAMTGLAAVLHSSAVAFETIKYLGVAYLLFLAWSMWRDGSHLDVEADQAPRPARRVILTGISINLLNPKLTIFIFAFLPQLVAPEDPSYLGRMMVLSAVFMAMTFVVFVGYGCFAAALRKHVVGRPQVLNRVRKAFAGSFVLLGAKLAFTSR